MWLSASAFFTAYFRVYSPIKFGQKYDKEGKFIKRFLPILKVCNFGESTATALLRDCVLSGLCVVPHVLLCVQNYPAKYIYEPWTASLEDQKVRRAAEVWTTMQND